MRAKRNCPPSILGGALASLLSLALFLTASGCRAEEKGQQPIDLDTPEQAIVRDVGSLKQLFIDDYIIAEMEALTKTFHPTKKYPENPIFTPETRWEKNMDFGIPLYRVLYDEKEQVHKMWYGYQPLCLATSKDGIKWERPNLGLVDFEGSKENNILPEGRDAPGLPGWLSPGLYTPEDPDPNRRYKTLFHTSEGKGAVFSSDGIHWKSYAGNPVIHHPTLGDVCTVTQMPEHMLERFAANPAHGARFRPGYGSPPSLPKYLAFPKLHPRVGRFVRRAIGFCYSEDFIHWSYPVLVLAPDERDDEMAEVRIAAAKPNIKWDHPEDHRTEFYGMEVFPYEGLLLGLLWIFDATMEMNRVPEDVPLKWGRTNQDGPMQVELTSSRDPMHWQRVGDREPFIALGGVDEWDSGELWYAVTDPIIVGDEIRFYYGGRNVGHGEERPDSGPPTYGIGLATLRLDGFVAIKAAEEEGVLTTKPLLFEGQRLEVNADASLGSIRVEIVDADGRPASGFSRNDADPIEGDSVRHTVTWKGNSEVASFKGKPIRLKFYMNRSQLYSFAFRSKGEATG